MRTCLVLVVLSLLGCGGSTAETITSTTAPVSEAASAAQEVAAPEPPDLGPVVTGDIAASLASPHRSDRERARDAHRHPAETLAFFGLEPSMTVVEVWPGGGWYTQVLAPVLRDHGKLIAANISTPVEGNDAFVPPFMEGFADRYNTRLAASPHLFDQIEHANLVPGDMMTSVPDASVDMVLVFRSAHNWQRWDGHEQADYFRAFARVLKPGGVVGFVQHRAHDEHSDGESGNTGYLKESLVLAAAEAAGLTLDARSEINANPNDTHEHPSGVWSLPPVLRGEDSDHEAMRAIGESDRMTFRFVKPATE